MLQCFLYMIAGKQRFYSVLLKLKKAKNNTNKILFKYYWTSFEKTITLFQFHESNTVLFNHFLS